jgi:hypothetical protein
VSAPSNTGAGPSVSGTAAAGQQLTCDPGSWSGNPSFTYQWSRDGAPISGATASTYTVQADDQGHSLTCTVTATNSAGSAPAKSSSSVSVPAASPPPPGPKPPSNTGAPTVAGTPTPGNALSCSPGAWSGSPTTYTYQWNRTGSSTPVGQGPSYAVQVADGSQYLSCTVTAFNAAGQSAPATSVPLLVAQPGTLQCPRPSGSIGGRAVGPLSLGMTRAAARKKLKKFSSQRSSVDDFCLYAGWGIRVGYGSSRLGKKFADKIVLALTSNTFYHLRGVSPGAKLASIKFKIGKPLHVGSNDWYIVAGSPSTVLKVRAGIVLEVGIADGSLTKTAAAQRKFLASLNSA